MDGRVLNISREVNERILKIANKINTQKLRLELHTEDLELSEEDLDKLAPYLTYVDISHNIFSDDSDEKLLNFIKKLERVKVLLIFSPTLTEISLPQSVQTFDCSSCNSLCDIKFTDELQNFIFNEAIHLSRLKLPLGLKLLDCDYSNIEGLTLPEGLQTLNCSNCGDIKNLILPESLLDLKCDHCKNFELNLPNSLLHLEFNCSDIINLHLPSRLESLVCRGCLNLERLELPESLIELNLMNNPKLNSLGIESLPNCQYICCCSCPNLGDLPETPANAVVVNDMEEEPISEYRRRPVLEELNVEGMLFVGIKTLEEEPLFELSRLGAKIEEENIFPFVVFLDPIGELPSSSLDMGGLGRHLVSVLFQTLCNKTELFQGEKGQKLPVLAKTASDDQQKSIKIIGKLFALCQISKKLTGSIFKEELFKAIIDLMNNTELSDEIIFSTLMGYKYASLDKETIESIPGHIAEKNIVYPVRLIVDEMKNIVLPRLFREMQPAQLRQKIEGLAINPDSLEKCIKWINGSSNEDQVNQMDGFLKNWIKEKFLQEPEKLEEFVLFITGNLSLSDDKLCLYLYPSRDKARYPEAHTCAKTLDLPVYDSQDEFNLKIETAISNMGFQNR